MKIAVIGAGGVGGYFGGRLIQGGFDVSFVARGDQLSALRRSGLRLESPLGNAHLKSVFATDSAADIGAVDYVLVAVKTWQLPDALRSIAPLVGKETCIVPLQNGVDAPSLLAERFGSEKVLGGMCGIFSYIKEPAVVAHMGGVNPFIRFGEIDNKESERAGVLCNALVDSGIDASVPPDIKLSMWQKFLFIAPIGGVSAMYQLTLDVVRENAEAKKMVTSAMAETVALAQSLGIGLTENDISQRLGLLNSSPIGATTSMQRDIASGKPSELDAQTGAIVRMGIELRVPTPTNQLIYQYLWPKEMHARKGTLNSESREHYECGVNVSAEETPLPPHSIINGM